MCVPTPTGVQNWGNDMKIAQLSTIIGLILTLGGGGYWFAMNTATAEDVDKANTKAEISIDLHIESLTSQLSRLLDKKRKNQADLDQIKYLRDKIQRLREANRR